MIALVALPARGLEPPIDIDDEARGSRRTRIETTPHEFFDEASRRAPLWLALDATLGHAADERPSFGMMLLLGLPLDRVVARPTSSRPLSDGASTRPPPPTLKSPRRERDDKLGDTPTDEKPAGRSHDGAATGPIPRSPSGPEELAPAESDARPPPLRVPRVVTPAVARAAVQAALQRAKLVDPDARIDALASRARTAALLPELRLRASRSVDEGQTLSPTEYDPVRTTASGGTSLWLEARATWRLDRLVFADEEVALERVKVQRAEAQAKLIERVLSLLFLWQRSLALEDDEAASPEEHLAALLKRIEAEAELDIVTAGWFTRWRESPPSPTRASPAR